MYRFAIIVYVALLVFLTGICLADIPKLINYQGMLTDDLGNPLTGSYDLTFYIYDDTTGGELEWSETQNGVQVENGLFNVVLGSQAALNIAFNESYWLAVKVGSETLPRVRITSVGYAYRASIADSALAAASGSGSNWSVSDSVLFTNNYWGIARGGAGNVLYGDSIWTMVNLGVFCTTGTDGQDYYYSTVGGGWGNLAGGRYATAGGGWGNRTTYDYATAGGGCGNSADAPAATVGGGDHNVASYSYVTIGGGYRNSASGYYATIAGGNRNVTSNDGASVGGGGHNRARGEFSVVAGGGGSLEADSNAAVGDYSVVPGGARNVAGGNYSFAAGREAQANHDGTFVWADDRAQSFTSTGNNQFLIRALGGVGIGTNSPSELLEVYSGQAHQTVFLELEASHGGLFEEVGIRFKTPAHTWHLRMDGYNHNNLPDTGSLALRSQTSGEVMVWTPDGNVGIGTTSPGSNKLAVNGTAAKPGGGTWATFSDARLKEVSGSYECGLADVDRLQPVRYRYKRNNDLGLPIMQEQVGLVAQDVRDVIPDAVRENEQGYLMLNSDPIIWAMLNAIKELKAENGELKQRIEALENK